uniref:AB hydrolase-1 domain-containing protein n=1 Tax=Fagus sylvatica TaxID=28930 RepID=A0A2N9IQL7_FAGSY
MEVTMILPFPAMIAPIAVAFAVGLLGWAYQALKPPPPKICGTPDGPPVTSTRVKLSDGRHLAYRESGVPKEEAKHKIIVIHGYDTSKDMDLPIPQLHLSVMLVKIEMADQELADQSQTAVTVHVTFLNLQRSLKIYIVFFDRAGYGDSDPCPSRSVKSEAFDVEQLADQLHVGLSGAALVVPFVNYWWPCFPANLAREALGRLPPSFQWTFRIAHYTPWLFYRWMTQTWFPTLNMSPEMLTPQDLEIVKRWSEAPSVGQEKIKQQGVYESLHRDIIAGYGKWEFDPIDITNPSPDSKGSVHIWQGYEDRMIPFKLNRYLSEKLPWIHYHEKYKYTTVSKEVLVPYCLVVVVATSPHSTPHNAEMFIVAVLVLVVSVMIYAYRSVKPPPPKICGTPNGPPVTSPRIRLGDGRHLAYRERGVAKENAKYKVILVHGFDNSKDIYLPLSQDKMDDLSIYIVSFDRAGYGESDPNPKRLAGVTLVVPVINYWWPSFPPTLANEGYKKQLKRDQWKLGIAHHAPALLYWWMTQKFFPYSSILQRHPILFNKRDVETVQKMSQAPMPNEHKIRQQGIQESLNRDLIVHFGNWEFDPMKLKNPFPNNEASVYLWHGHEDKLVPYELQRYVVKKLPWIRYHEVPDGGHLMIHESSLCEAMFKEMLLGEEPIIT